MTSMRASIKNLLARIKIASRSIINKVSRKMILAVCAMITVFLLGALSSLIEPKGGSSWVHMSIYKGKMILGLAKLPGLPGGLSMSTARYEFETIAKISEPGVWHLTTTDSKNVLAIERSTGTLLLLSPENKGYKEKILSPSVFPKDDKGVSIINADKTKVNSKPPIAMGLHYGHKKLLYSLVLQSVNNGKICQKLVLFEVPLPSIDKEPGQIIERFSTPCSADKDNTVMWGGRIAHNDKKIFLSIGEQRYDRSGYPKTKMFSADELVVHKTVFGKILAFDPTTFKYEVYSSGHRNAQGLFWDKDNSLLLSAEHGPNGGDEVNVIVKGNDYGWPRATFGKPYSTMFPSNEPILNDAKNPGSGVDLTPERKGYLTGTHEGVTPPLMSWSPGVGIGNLTRIALDSPLKDWRNDILVATMGENHLHRLRTYKGAVVFDENIAVNARFRDILALANGDIVFSLDKGDLLIMRVSNE